MTGELKNATDNIEDNTIKIRKAKPDLNEGLLFAQFFNEASEGFFESILGTKTFEIIAAAYVKPNNSYSYEYTSVIEYDGKIIGMVSGYSLAEKKEFEKKILSQFKKGSKLRILIFSVIGKLLTLFLGPQGKDDYYLQAIAVDIQLRGKGLGQKLMEHSKIIAIKKGCNKISLDVSSKNENAIKSYHKFGMHVTSHWPNFLKLPPVFTRMVKEL